MFFDHLKCLLPNEDIILEHMMRFYSFDIAFPKHKLLIEVDGDFWHVNEDQGYSCDYDVQKRNLANDKRKNGFVATLGWTLIRVWVSDIENDLNGVTTRILNHVR